MWHGVRELLSPSARHTPLLNGPSWRPPWLEGRSTPPASSLAHGYLDSGPPLLGLCHCCSSWSLGVWVGGSSQRKQSRQLCVFWSCSLWKVKRWHPGQRYGVCVWGGNRGTGIEPRHAWVPTGIWAMTWVHTACPTAPLWATRMRTEFRIPRYVFIGVWTAMGARKTEMGARSNTRKMRPSFVSDANRGTATCTDTALDRTCVPEWLYL